MNRYVLSEHDHPLSSDYYYEAVHTTDPCGITVRSHSHDYYEIWLFVRGEVQFMLDNHIFPIQRGDVVIIPPYHVHSLMPLGSETPYERMYLYITDACLSSFQFNEHSLLKPVKDAVKLGRYHYRINSEEDYARITHAIDCIYESKKSDYYGKEMLNRSYLIQMFTTINSYILKEAREKPVHETSSLISRIIAYINENFNEDITLDILCERFYTNRQTLTKLFKEYTTMTIHNYITLIRITQAKFLISKGNLPTKLHSLCGFNDYTTFYRAFKRLEGITPQQYDELYQKEN